MSNSEDEERVSVPQRGVTARNMDAEIDRIRGMLRVTINPNGRFLRRWDLALLVALLLTAVVTPYEIAFLDGFNGLLFTFNLVITLVFCADILVNLRTPFRESPKKGARWIYNPRSIRRHYLRGKFGFDLITTLPLDWFMYGVVQGSPGFEWRIVRALRLLRMSQLTDIVRRYVNFTSIDLSMLELVKFGLMTGAAAHWLACFWGFIGRQRPNDPIDMSTWFVADRTQQSWIQKHQFTNASSGELYTACLYVALSNIFGGPCEINPANYGEYIAQCFMMFLGSSLWAYIIGSSVAIVASLSPQADEHRRIIGMLNYFVRDKKIDPDLAARLRLYFNETSSMRYFANKNEELMHTMTSQLRGEASFESARAMFTRVWFFNPRSPLMSGLDIEDDFFTRLGLLATTVVYARKESINCDQLMIVDRGLIARSGRIGLGYVGEDFIISDTYLRDGSSATALTSLVQMIRLLKSDLDSILPQFPVARKRIRKAAIRMTFQLSVLKTAAFARTYAEKDETFNGRRSILEAFQSWSSSKGGGPLEDLEMKTKVEKRVAELDSKVDDLRRSIDRRFDELVNALGTKKLNAAAKKLAKGKSVPPPLPRGVAALHAPPEASMSVILAATLSSEQAKRSNGALPTPPGAVCSTEEASERGRRQPQPNAEPPLQQFEC